MGRDLRRVPPDWVHPVYTADNSYSPEDIGKPKPTFDNDIETAAEEWLENLDLFRQGKHEIQLRKDPCSYKYYWEYDSPPDPERHRTRKWSEEEATAYQVYENVTEGKPVSPVLLTYEALINWLVGEGYSVHSAKEFAEVGYAPSGMIYNSQIAENIHSFDLLGKNEPIT